MSALGFGATLGVRAGRVGGIGFDLAAALPAGAVFTRASPGTRVDATGRLVREGADVARFDADPLTGAARGLLIEAAATNLALASEAFEASAWAATGTAVVVDAESAPDGQRTADRIVETTTSQQHRLTQTIATTVGATYTLSAHVRAGERSRVLLRFAGATTVASATLVMATRTATATAGTVRVVELAGGWFRLLVTGTADAAGTSVHINLLDAQGTAGYTGTPGEGLFVWGVQFEAGAGSSYVATTASTTATRAADALTLDWGRAGVPDGAATIRHSYDDGTASEVATTIAGGRAGVPPTPVRARLRRAALV